MGNSGGFGLDSGRRGGTDSRVGGLVINMCDIRPARRRAEALVGGTVYIGETIGEVSDGCKPSPSSGLNHGCSFLARRRGGGSRAGSAMVRGVVDGTQHRRGARASVLEDKHQISAIEHLGRNARVEVPVDVGPGGGLGKKLTYEKHSSVQKFENAVWKKGVAGGRAIVFPKE